MRCHSEEQRRRRISHCLEDAQSEILRCAQDDSIVGFFRSLFSPAKIAAPALYSSRTPRSLRLRAARGAGHKNNQNRLVTAGLKPRPSKIVVRNPG
jgi:hypothetical protein